MFFKCGQKCLRFRKIRGQGNKLLLPQFPPTRVYQLLADDLIESIPEHPARNARGDGIRRNIFGHQGTCADNGASADPDASPYFRAFANPYIGPDNGTNGTPWILPAFAEKSRQRLSVILKDRTGADQRNRVIDKANRHIRGN